MPSKNDQKHRRKVQAKVDGVRNLTLLQILDALTVAVSLLAEKEHQGDRAGIATMRTLVSRYTGMLGRPDTIPPDLRDRIGRMMANSTSLFFVDENARTSVAIEAEIKSTSAPKHLQDKKQPRRSTPFNKQRTAVPAEPASGRDKG